MIVVRRTFVCKPGRAGPAVELCKSVIRIVREADPAAGAQRLYTDLSGRTDRIVIETEYSTFVHPRELSSGIHSHPEAATVFPALLEYLSSAETEYYELELAS